MNILMGVFAAFAISAALGTAAAAEKIYVEPKGAFAGLLRAARTR